MEVLNGGGSPKIRDAVPTLEELRDWSICYVDAGQGFVGLMRRGPDGQPLVTSDGACLLDPCYLMMGNYQIGPQGVHRARAILPVEMLVDQLAWPVKPCMVLHLRQLSEGDFEVMANPIRMGVEQAENVRRELRAQRSGISLVGAGAKLPPFPGPRRG